MPEFTGGDWILDDLGASNFLETNYRYGIGSRAKPTYRIAKIEGMGEEALANGRLIVMAPQMFKALSKLVALMDSVLVDEKLGDETDRVFPHYEFDEARAVLAKIKGENNA